MTVQASRSLRKTLASVSCCMGAEIAVAATSDSADSRFSDDPGEVRTAIFATASYWRGASRPYRRQSSISPPTTHAKTRRRRTNNAQRSRKDVVEPIGRAALAACASNSEFELRECSEESGKGWEPHPRRISRGLCREIQRAPIAEVESGNIVEDSGQSVNRFFAKIGGGVFPSMGWGELGRIYGCTVRTFGIEGPIRE